jgi:hypothetical protein
MTTINISVREFETQSGFENPTTANVSFIVNDSPRNADKHLRLLGLLSVVKLVLSDDDGKFSVSILEKEKNNG